MLATEGDFARLIERITSSPHVYCDLETTGLDPYGGDRLIGVALTNGELAARGQACYFPFRHASGVNLPLEFLPRLIRAIEPKLQIGWNYPFDVRFLWKEGMSYDIRIRDCMLDHHLLNENARSFALKTLATTYVNKDAAKAEKELEKILEENLLGGKGEMYRLPPEKCQKYACDDVLLTYEMDIFQRPHITKQGLESVSDGVNEYAIVVSRMIERGVLINKKLIPGIVADTRQEMIQLWHQARDWAGRSINLDSPQQVCAWLNVKSSSKEALDKLRQTDDVKLVQRYRKLSKGISSYYLKMSDMADEHDVLRCDMRLHGTISGRLAVRDPPMQSLPTDTSLYRVKDLIIARPGYEIIQADYSQAEIKIASHYGREMAMAAIISSGQNMHDVVSKENSIPRDAAKRLNFSVIYGIGSKTLALKLNISESQAAKYLSKYHSKYPGFKRLYDSMDRFAKAHGYIDMYTKRRRHYNAGYLTPTHKASSNLVQGTVAEITRERQTALHKELLSYDVHQLLQVHDSAIMEAPIGQRKKLIPMIRDIMEIRNKFILPMTVDISCGPNLGELE